MAGRTKRVRGEGTAEVGAPKKAPLSWANCNIESQLASNIVARLPTFDRFLSPLFL